MTLNPDALNAFLGLLASGGLLSIVIEVINRVFKAHALAARGITVLLCFALSAFFVLYSGTPWFATFMAILSGASLVFAFVIREFPAAKNDPKNNQPTATNAAQPKDLVL